MKYAPDVPTRALLRESPGPMAMHDGGPKAAEVDPDLVALLAARSPQDRYVAATVVLHDSIHPRQPSTDASFLHFERVVDDLIARISESTDRGPDWVYPSPVKWGCELLAPARFVARLVQEPEVARAFNGLILNELDDVVVSASD